MGDEKQDGGRKPYIDHSIEAYRRDIKRARGDKRTRPEHLKRYVSNLMRALLEKQRS